MSLGSCLGGRVKSVFGEEGAEDGIVTEDLLGKIRLIKWESGSGSLVLNMSNNVILTNFVIKFTRVY